MIKQGLIYFFEYLLMLMIILEFNTPYIYFPIIKNTVILLIIISAVVLILFNWRNLTLDAIAFTFLIIVGALFPFLNVYEGKTIAYIKLYFVILPLLLILTSSYMSEERESVSHLFIKFSNIVAVIAIISLFFWFLGSTLELIPSTAIIPNSWGGDRFIPTYFGIYFETQEGAAYKIGSMIRNSGIFNEAPMYNMILCTALSIELFLRPTIYIKRLILITLTIITTISTTGLIFMFVVYTIKGCNGFASRYRLQMILLLPILLLASLFVMNCILENKKEVGEGSYSSRSRDIVKCFEVGLEHPINGIGIMHANKATTTDNFGYSNSLFGTFAHGGLYFLFLYLIPLFLIPFFVGLKYGDYQLSIIIFCYFLLFTFTLSQYKVLTLLIISYSLAYWGNAIFRVKSYTV